MTQKVSSWHAVTLQQAVQQPRQLADVRPKALLHHVIDTAQQAPLHCGLLPATGCNTCLAAIPQDQTSMETAARRGLNTVGVILPSSGHALLPLFGAKLL
ncbi:MAG: hypothetical protein FRX49_11216 [Trebouxia sp. A1-2]|nr:MAG: hypothetical protein FRX49_11216 [Trebouxia sp. A1-2]